MVGKCCDASSRAARRFGELKIAGILRQDRQDSRLPRQSEAREAPRNAGSLIFRVYRQQSDNISKAPIINSCNPKFAPQLLL